MSELTDREKIILLATEFMGWLLYVGNPGRPLKRSDCPCFYPDPSNVGWVNFYEWEDEQVSCRDWNPLEDISDAMEMQAKIPEALRFEYCKQVEHFSMLDKGPLNAADQYWCLVNATARQRCDAAISVLEAKR